MYTGLILYADLLESKLPEKDTTTNPDIALSIGDRAPFAKTQMTNVLMFNLLYGLVTGQVKSTCLILNTAEYCSETVSQLQDMVQKVRLGV